MRKLLLILLCFPFLVFSQNEKRLALVIGNANYEVGELKNPVNDALLVARTLDSLGFDVILDTNLTDERSFIKSIRQFGERRDEYDVGFIYYAGHGVQVDGVNYLLPTKEVFQSEEDVYYNGVAVNDIMKYLTAQSGRVNIMVLDACRNNPFEHKWNPQRSLEGGSGLAKIQPPSGSLIAFSTDEGETATDGLGENSVYCESLCRNMLREETSIEQVFKYVRSDVEEATNGRQSPVEMQKMTGKAFYLVTSDYSVEYEKANNYLKNKEYQACLDLLGEILLINPNDIRVMTLKVNVYFKMGQKGKRNDYVIKQLDEILDVDSNNYYAHDRLSRYLIYFISSGYLQKADTITINKAYFHLNKAIENAPDKKMALKIMSDKYVFDRILGRNSVAINTIEQILDIDPLYIGGNDLFTFFNVSTLSSLENPFNIDYSLFQPQLDSLLTSYISHIYKSQKIIRDTAFYHFTGDVYKYLEDYKNAISEYESYLNIFADNVIVLEKLKYSYDELENSEAKEREINKKLFYLTSDVQYVEDIIVEFIRNQEFDAIEEYINSLCDGGDNHTKMRLYEITANELSFSKGDYSKGLEYYSKAVELDTTEFQEALYNKIMYQISYYNYIEALIDIEKYIQLDAYWNKSIHIMKHKIKCFFNLGMHEQAISLINQTLEDTSRYLYNNEKGILISERANYFLELGMHEKAFEDLYLLIEFQPKIRNYYKLASALIKQEKQLEAIEIINTSLKTISERDYYYKSLLNLRASAYWGLLNYDKALEEYARVIEIDPEYVVAFNNRGLIYISLGEHDNALEEYARCIDLDPEYRIVYYNRALLYSDLGEYDKALEDYARCVEIDPKEPAPYFEMAKVYHKLQRFDKEIQTYQKVIEVNVEDPEGYYYIGVSYLNDNNYLQTLKYFNDAIQKLSSDLGYYISTENDEKMPLRDLYIQRAEIYEKLGGTDLMCEDYEKACDLGNCAMFNAHCK